MPAKAVNGEHYARLVQMKKFECPRVLFPNATRGDSVRKIQICLCPEVGKDRLASEGRFVGGDGIPNAAKRQQGCGTINVRLSMIEVVRQLEVAIKQLECNVRMGASKRASLDAQVLRLPSCTPQPLVERTFDGFIPCGVAEPLSGHRCAA
jgi:hypothetical protein